ncbi:MAG TPA: glutaredoxin domain-containing protein [Ilumatobacteraceae bacterium]|jgi:mycoredoxin|nr:glutaredoxin domain-containing protein [Ilumatobacteraceae bacterium]
MPDDAATPSRIDLYWRPGCGFCSMLQRKLDKLGIERVEHNIWENSDDAAIVRRHANGNETVPTVVIGDRGFVNPSAGELIAYLGVHHPALLPEDFEAPEPSAVGRLATRVFG